MTWTEFLSPVLRIVGAGLIVQSFAHIHLHKRLKWSEEAARMSPFNAAVFHVHTFFICVVLVMMGLPLLVDPALILERSRPGAWAAWFLCIFWGCRLVCQFVTYKREWWEGKKFESAMDTVFTGVWAALTIIFGLCGAIQAGWIL